MLNKGKVFRVNDKVYRAKKELQGYDEYYIPQELNRLISLGIVEKVRNATDNDMKNSYFKLNEYPLNY